MVDIFEIVISEGTKMGRSNLLINAWIGGNIVASFTGKDYTWRGCLAAITRFKNSMNKEVVFKEATHWQQLSFMPSDDFTEEFSG